MNSTCAMNLRFSKCAKPILWKLSVTSTGEARTHLCLPLMAQARGTVDLKPQRPQSRPQEPGKLALEEGSRVDYLVRRAEESLFEGSEGAKASTLLVRNQSNEDAIEAATAIESGLHGGHHPRELAMTAQMIPQLKVATLREPIFRTFCALT